MDSNMYIPLSLGITTLLSLLAVIIGQIVTLFKVHNIEKTRVCGMLGAGAVAAAASTKTGWFKAAWEFVKLTFGKIKDKFKDKAADKIADSTVETAQETLIEKPVEVKK